MAFGVKLADMAIVVKKKKGEKWYQMLRIRAEQIYKPDYNLIKLDLLQELKKHE